MVTVLPLAQCAYILDDPERKLAVALSGRENDRMTSYSPHSLGGASSPSLPLPNILQPQGMAEESLAENQLVPEAGLQTGKGARRASSRMELKRADLKKTLPGKIEGWGGKQGQRDGDTDGGR